MCKSQAEGGQRCADSARHLLEFAEADYDAMLTVDNHDLLQLRRAEFASTRSGREELQDRWAGLDRDSIEAIDLANAIRRGILIAERNKAVGTANRDVTNLGDRDAQMRMIMDAQTPPVLLEQVYRRAADDTVRRYALQSPAATETMLTDAVHNRLDPHLDQIVAEHPGATSDHLDTLSLRDGTDQADRTRALTARHRNLSAWARGRMSTDADDIVRGVIANRPDNPGDAVERFTRDESPNVRECVVEGGRLTAEQEDRLSRDSHPRVRGAVARYGTRTGNLARLMRDPDCTVGLAQNVHAGFLADQVIDASRHDSYGGHEIRQLVAANGGATVTAFARLSTDPDDQTRYLVAANSSTPDHVLEPMRNDPNPTVAQKARRALAARAKVTV